MATVDAAELGIKEPPARSRKTATRTQAAKATVSSGNTYKREEAINGLFQLGGFGLIVAGQHADAGALGKYGPGIAREAAKLAETNDGVANLIDYLTEAGPYAGLVTACMPLLLQILANHKIMRAENLAGAGVVAPEAIAAEVRTQLAQQQADALKAQSEAERILSDLQAEASFHANESAANGEAPK